MLPQAGIELNAFTGDDVTSEFLDSLDLGETIFLSMPYPVKLSRSYIL
ncbi:hypothetical protein PN463_01090 [Dolichospermum circinale CS-537/03]|nr:hypothetical protein [Dolichospermum circinale]MDB9476282.1 hypothetical protein [Dolichospermum circinale CS-537/11]MDB9477212.1 hypothetical protein [Dolichospermum circinale CS-537/03]MDB9483441.1 hypothetical protein [Dolichospermum circinale CS-537/05]